MVALFAAAAAPVAAESSDACSAVSAAHQTALVELYTSQGCSSCPPADRWLSQLEPRHPRNRVVPIALHVDYWDHIGWRDPYARGEFTARQRALATANGARTVYTPGVFIQGQEFPQWSGRPQFDNAVRTITSTPAVVRIKLSASVQATSVTVNASAFALPSAHAPRLYLALVEDGLALKVRAGENRGEMLRNDRVAREWRGPLPLDPAPHSWNLPADRARYSIVAFAVEMAPSARVLQAVDLPLRGC
jgi:hypothetical protein